MRWARHPCSLTVGDVRGALAEGRIDAAEWLGPHLTAAPDLQPLAGRLYHPGLHPHGALVSLDVRGETWRGLSVADQAIFEGCAAEAYQLSLAEAQAHALIAAQIDTPAKWPVRQQMTRELSDALEQAAGDVVRQIAEHDEDAGRIHASHSAFRAMLGDARTA